MALFFTTNMFAMLLTWGPTWRNPLPILEARSAEGAAATKPFTTFEDFYPLYMQQHSQPLTKLVRRGRAKLFA